MALPLSPQVFVILRSLVEEKTGLHYDDDQRDVLAQKISPRAEEAGFESLLDYYYFLRYDEGGGAELDALVEHLVVQETYLFREADQLRTLVSKVVAPRVRAGERVRIWCAAAATGEEPITLAMLLADAGILDGVELLATDISRRALAAAREGRFARRSLRALRVGIDAAAWIKPQADGSVCVAPELVTRIRWEKVNLLDEPAVCAQGMFDVILCRNVLIYFSDETVKTVIQTLTSVLRPSGVLLVSVTESLLRFGTSLVGEESEGVFFYRKAHE